jgi:hypothetical protein
VIVFATILLAAAVVLLAVARSLRLPFRMGIVTFPDGTYFQPATWYPSPLALGFYRRPRVLCSRPLQGKHPCRKMLSLTIRLNARLVRSATYR